MASLTPRNITKTSADLSSIKIGSAESLNHIPSINLIQELSANLSKKYENLDSILNLNEVKYLGTSETDPTTGIITLHGIQYNVEDLDQGNIVFYEDLTTKRYDPDTGLVVPIVKKYILGLDKVWDVAGDLVNIPDGYIVDRHVRPDANIQMSKIGGLLDRLNEMQHDIDQIDITTEFSELSGVFEQNIVFNISGDIDNLITNVETHYNNISGNISQKIEHNVQGIVQNFQSTVDTKISEVNGNVEANTSQIYDINAEIVNLTQSINSRIDGIVGNVSTNSNNINVISSNIANLDQTILNSISQITGDVNWYSLVYNDVTAEIVNMSNTIYTSIKDIIAEDFVAQSTFNANVSAQVASLSNDFLQQFMNISCVEFVNTQAVNLSVNAVSASIFTNVQQAFANCSFGEFVNTFTGSEADKGTIMYFGGIYSSLQDANLDAALKANISWNPSYTVPVIDRNAAGEWTTSLSTGYAFPSAQTIYLMNRGCVVLVGTTGNNFQYTAYILNGFTGDRSTQNAIWLSLHNENKYFKKSDIKVVTPDKLPTSPAAMTEGELYFVVDEN